MTPKKSIVVIYTIIMGRKNYIAQHTSSSAMTPGHKVVNYTTRIEDAKEFDNEPEAEAFIPLIVNPAGRQFVAATETIPIQKQTAKEEAPRLS